MRTHYTRDDCSRSCRRNGPNIRQCQVFHFFLPSFFYGPFSFLFFLPPLLNCNTRCCNICTMPAPESSHNNILFEATPPRRFLNSHYTASRYPFPSSPFYIRSTLQKNTVIGDVDCTHDDSKDLCTYVLVGNPCSLHCPAFSVFAFLWCCGRHKAPSFKLNYSNAWAALVRSYARTLGNGKMG